MFMTAVNVYISEGTDWLHGYYAGVLGLPAACGPEQYLLGYKRGHTDRLGEGESND